MESTFARSLSTTAMSDSDDEVTLSPYALAALQDFLAEKQQKEEVEVSGGTEFEEDWQLSQFWVTNSTQPHNTQTH